MLLTVELPDKSVRLIADGPMSMHRRARAQLHDMTLYALRVDTLRAAHSTSPWSRFWFQLMYPSGDHGVRTGRWAAVDRFEFTARQ